MQKIVPKSCYLPFTRLQRPVLILLVAAGLMASSLVTVKIVRAQSIQQQINELTQQNAQNQAAVEQLEQEAASYEDAINKLKSQIEGLQQQIDTNVKKQETLKQEIEKAQVELDKQKKLLGQNIRAMYVEGDISTIEMLASSSDLSEFVDKQQYRYSVKTKILETLDKVNQLKNQLRTQKDQVDTLIKEQEAQRAELASSRNEQSRLLAFNQSQQAEYNAKTKQNQQRISELLRQQAIQNAALFGSGGGQIGGGGYPWGNAPCLSTGQIKGWCPEYEWGYNGSYNNWQNGGYAYRNCTDWVAYRVRVAGGYVPSGLGHAKMWDDNAPRYGLTVGSTPRVGAAAVSNSGYYGHVMYVEAVNSDGSIVISDYNRAGPGEYGMSTLSASIASTLSYIYF